jgi:DNA-binding response OmpR family regulator
LKGQKASSNDMKKILIVEDDPDVAKALAIRLEFSGYEVNVAQDALLGVTKAVKEAPDLALLDISLPAGDGFTVADRIQELLPQDTPFIFLTASKQPDLRKKARLLGAVDFFEKPYDTERLLTSIKVALSE